MNETRAENARPAGSDREKAVTERRLKIIVAIVAVVLLVSFFVVHHLKSTNEKNLANAASAETSAPPIVDVITVQNAPPTLSLTLPGETAAWYESTIYARVDGYVDKWNADIGDHVQKGQILASIDTPELDAELAAARAKLKASEALVAAHEADMDLAKTTYDRWRDSPKGVVSEQEREEKKAGYDSAAAQLKEAQAQTVLDKANVDHYTTLTQFKHVAAPYDGTITERRIDIGNLVTAGSTTNTTLLYRMVQDDPIRVFVDVPQSAAGDIKIDTPAAISASNLPDHVFDGKVARTADAINPQTRTMRVEVDIPNPNHTLASGMYVNGTFQVPTGGLVQIPAAALVFRSGAPQVAVIDKEQRVVFRKVTIARDNGNTVEIGSGISSGDKIALNIGSQVTEGETVEAHAFKEDAVVNNSVQK